MKLTTAATAIALAIVTASPVYAGDGYHPNGGNWHGNGSWHGNGGHHGYHWNGSNWVWGAPLLGATALALGLAAPYYYGGYSRPYYYSTPYPYPYPTVRWCQGPYGAYQC